MIWLIGCNGMLGTEISEQLTHAGISFVGTDREVDITQEDQLLNFVSSIKNMRPGSTNWIINCSAYTAVDKAEDEVQLANLLNNTGALHIAKIARQLNAKLIHISTDYVFDGTASSPYTETDKPNATSVYGKTKLAGEQAIINTIKGNAYIIRTAWLYGKHGKNFVETMLRLMSEKETIKVVNDQYGSPTNAHDLAKTIIKMMCTIDSGTNIPSGIYHYTNLGETSWYNFALEIYHQGTQMGLLKNKCAVLPCTTAEYHTKAKRPDYSVLSKDKIMNTLGIAIPDWREGLKEYLNEKGNV